MFSTILGFLGSIPALIKLISQVLGIVGEIRRAFQKDPVDEIAKDAGKQKEAEKAAGEKDDTSGTFGGA